jgi:hypothetical protein
LGATKGQCGNLTCPHSLKPAVRPSRFPSRTNSSASRLVHTHCCTWGRTQKALVRHLILLLNYRYGLDLIIAKSFYEGSPPSSVTAASSCALQQSIEQVFSERGVGELFSDEVLALPFEQMQQRVAQRIRNVKTLPTLPEVALRIMSLVGDADGSIEELQDVLTSDPAIAHKLLQVVNSPLFASSGHKGRWTMHDAIVRLGRHC